MKHTRTRRVATLVSLMFGFALLGCGECGSNLVGKWECGLVPISVYENGVASFAAVKATWSSVATDLILLEYAIDGETIIAELELVMQDAEGGRVAIYKSGDLREECKEL